MQTRVDRVSTPIRTRRIWPVAGFLAYLITGPVFLVGGLLFVPGLWLLPLGAIWLAGLWVAHRLMVSRSHWILAAAPIALIFFWAYVEAGWSLWGWVVEDLPLNVR